jgi:hypothetical protein
MRRQSSIGICCRCAAHDVGVVHQHVDAAEGLASTCCRICCGSLTREKPPSGHFV